MRQLVVQAQEAAHALVLGVEGHAAPVDLAHADHAAGLEQVAHLHERVDRPAQVLQHLVREDGIEALRREAGLVDAADLERQVRRRRVAQRAGGVDHALRRIDADRLARRHAPGQPGRDRARPAADVEQAHAGAQQGEKERRVLVGRALGVVGDDRGMVAVLVDLVGGRGTGHRQTPNAC